MRHLLMISMIAQRKSISHAANEMGLTPSALSHRLAEAERRVGSKLFDRTGRSVTLTPAGETLYRTSRTVVAMVAQAESDIEWLAGEFDQTLRICMAYYANYDWLAQFLRDWRQDCPGIHVCVVSDAKQHALDRLRDGMIDLCVVPFVPRDPDLVAMALFQDELVLVASPYLALTAKDHIVADDLASVDFLTYTRVVVHDQEYERFLKPDDARPARLVDMEVPEVIADLAAEGYGVSILARWAMKKWIDSGRLKALKVSPKGLPITWSAVTRKSQAHADSALLLSNALVKFFADPDQPRLIGPV